MCGIFATTEAAVWRPLLGRVTSMLARRGPDAHGSCEPADDILLAHTRLSIIGLGDAGRQPAQSKDGTVTISFNGEIYNYAELAARLGCAGEPSDTQVLAEVLACRSPDQLGSLRGMYAFAAWDSSTSTLTAMRDPFGIKPLYALHHADGGVTLCSELGPLLLHPESRRIDDLGLGQYLAFGHTGPVHTVFEPIQKLLPGRLYAWRRSSAGRWESTTHAPEAGRFERAGSVYAALQDSVAAHQVADVEVGCFLSGGIDSTLVAALAVRTTPGLRTFTLGFPESPDRDESPLAAANAAQLGTRHTTVPVTQAEMAECARIFLREHGEPFGDAAVLPLTFLSRAAAEKVKVVLCGEGADELFGGYGRYRVSRMLGRASAALQPVTSVAASRWATSRSGQPWARALEAVLWGGGVLSHAALLDADITLIGHLRPDVRTHLVDQLTAEWAALDHGDERARAQQFDLLCWLPNVYLEKTDRATMASGLEARVPYLDPVLSQAVAGAAPPDQLKAPLRRMLFDLLPHVVLPDRKKGLAVDIVPMVQRYLSAELQYELHDPGSLLQRWAGPRGAQHVAERCRRSPYLLFRVAMLGLWESEFDGTRFECSAA